MFTIGCCQVNWKAIYLHKLYFLEKSLCLIRLVSSYFYLTETHLANSFKLILHFVPVSLRDEDTTIIINFITVRGVYNYLWDDLIHVATELEYNFYL